MNEFQAQRRLQIQMNHREIDTRISTDSSSPPSPPPYSSAPTLAEIEKHESGIFSRLDFEIPFPLRSSSISESRIYPTLSHGDLTSFDASNRPLRNSQIYNTVAASMGSAEYHEYQLPPFQCRPRPPLYQTSQHETSAIRVKKVATIQKSQRLILRPSWFNRVIMGEPTLQITKTVELKVPIEQKCEFEKFSYHQLKKFKGTLETDHVALYNPKNHKFKK